MKQLSLHLAWLLSVTALIAGCSSGIDKKKFEPAERAALAVRKSIDNMDGYGIFSGAYETFAQEVLLLRDRVTTGKERKLLTQYTELLSIYHDGLQLWAYQVESSRYPWIPEGKIYIEPKILYLALKYHLPVESHMVELTRHAWKSVPADSLKIIWERARVQHGKLGS